MLKSARLETQYAGQASMLLISLTALRVTLDRSTPFFRGEDCRHLHRARLEANVQHHYKRMQAIREQLDQCLD